MDSVLSRWRGTRREGLHGTVGTPDNCPSGQRERPKTASGGGLVIAERIEQGAQAQMALVGAEGVNLVFLLFGCFLLAEVISEITVCSSA